MKLTTLLAVYAMFGPFGDYFRLPPHRDAFFIENNLVYRRFLALMHDGTYRQINQDRTMCAEVDQGTWEQSYNSGLVRLHSNHHALRFRALMAGPLTVVLDSQAKLDALLVMASAIWLFLDKTHDQVFGAGSAKEFGAVVRPGTETFSRDDAQSLMQQMQDTAECERTGIYLLHPALPGDNDAMLLILQGAVFEAADVARVRRDYPAKGKEPPPFYFAQVDAHTFARQVGSWQVFRFLGEPD